MIERIVVPGLAAPPMVLKPGSGGTKPGGRKPARKISGSRKKKRTGKRPAAKRPTNILTKKQAKYNNKHGIPNIGKKGW